MNDRRLSDNAFQKPKVQVGEAERISSPGLILTCGAWCSLTVAFARRLQPTGSQ
jgi:hypothetical protein